MDQPPPHPHANTSKYKQYVIAVDKALKAFECTNEWADLISALGKLAKVFAQNSKYTGEIPKQVIVAKRLSQCLHPALPMGVHLKALDTYRQIFDILGAEALSKQLYLYAVGLFPLMDHCGIKVKGELLSIFEQYMLPLGEKLRPSLPGFLAGVLLGLEEGTEYYDRSFQLLDNVCEAVGASAFYTCLWQTVLGSPSVRLPALIYVNAKFDRNRNVEEQMFIVGDDVPHMVAALCAASDDTGTPLVQRNLLDLLCAAFALDSTTLSRSDFVQLLRRCIFVVLRRDMSLNRRLYTWILNPSGVSTSVSSVPVGDDVLDTSFFVQTALPMIVDALSQFLELDTVEIATSASSLISMASASSGQSKDAETQQFVEVRLSRLLTYLQDRPEVGRPVLMRVLPMLLIKCARLLDKDELEEGGQLEEEKSEADHDDTKKRLSLRMPNAHSDTNGAETSSGDGDRALKRRREEMAKNLNVLMQSVDDDGFLWEYLARWYHRLLGAIEAGGSVENGDCNNHRNDGPAVSTEQAVRELIEFPKVVSYALSVAQLNSTAAVRTRHLPRLLTKILGRVAQLKLEEEYNEMVLATLRMAGRLLKEITHAGGPVTVDHSETEPRSPLRSTAELFDEKEQQLVESCQQECLGLLTAICHYYKETRGSSRWPLLRSVCALLRQFADFPLYCAAGGQSSATYTRTYPKQKLPDWVKAIIEVVDIDSWQAELADGVAHDYEPRATCLECLVRLAIRSASVVAQHAALEDRSPPGARAVDSSSTTVLLKPLLHEGHLRALDENAIFDRSAAAVWEGAGADWPMHQAQAAQLVALLHSRRPSEPSSSVEQIIIAGLTSADTVMSTETARTFHRVWTLTRAASASSDEPLGPGIVGKSFNRVVMLLLGVLADDSVSFEKVELKSVATAWFVDCARHNDLPTIIQMVAMMLMNPATARVSIQYVKQENKLSQGDMSSLPPNAAAYTLITSDQRQRLHHLVDEEEDEAGGSSAWLSDVRSRLLLNSTKEARRADDAIPPEPPTRPSDILIFDEEETDSLDTLSISMDPSIDPVVVETLQWIIDCVVDEEESELDAQRKFDEAMNRHRAPKRREEVATKAAAPITSPAHSDISVSTASGMTAEEVALAEQAAVLAAAVASGAAPFPPSGPSVPRETITRMRKSHRRQDSLAETIFSMTSTDFRLFEGTPGRESAGKEREPGGTITSTSSTDSDRGPMHVGGGGGGPSKALYHDLHVYMLLYEESGRIVDLGRAETGFRILTALLRPRGAPVPASILLNCLVSSATGGNAGAISAASLTASGEPGSSSSLCDLMARHVRAILGQQFWANVKDSAESSSEESRTKNLTLLELLITIGLHFLRSFFVNSPIAPVTFSDLVMSWKCKIAVLELLTELLRELSSMILAQQSKEFVNFVQSILNRAKLQKCLLLLLVASVHDPRKNLEDTSELPLSMLIAEFNEGRRAKTTRKNGKRPPTRLAGLVAAYNRALLSLTAASTRLEFEIKHGFSSYTDPDGSGGKSSGVLSGSLGTIPRYTIREIPASLPELRVFLVTVLNALKRCPERHEGWLQLVINILPWLDRALPKVCMRVTEQLCKNIETAIGVAYPRGEKSGEDSTPCTPSPDSDIASGRELGTEFPANFVVMTMETLTTVLHFCVVDAAALPSPGLSTPGGSASSSHHQHGTSTGSLASQNGGVAGPASAAAASTSMMGQALSIVPGTQLFTNVVKLFSFGDNSSSVPLKLEQRTTGSSWKQARTELLTGLPHALATICDVWSVVQSGKTPLKPVGSPQQLRRLVLDLLSPIAQHHQQQFLSALALVWLTRGDTRDRDTDRPCFEYSRAQLDIAHLLLDLKVIPFETLVHAIGDVLRESGAKGVGGAGKLSFNDKPASFPTESPLLELLHGCVKGLHSTQLGPAWPSLHSLMSEAPVNSLPARAVFLLFIILSDFVRECSPCAAPVEDRMKAVGKQVQEVTHRLIEACNGIIAWQLEQPTWLKRTLVVRHDGGFSGVRSTDSTPSSETAPLPSLASADSSQRASTVSLLSNKPSAAVDAASASQFSLRSSGSNLRASVKDNANGRKDPAESTRALFLLAENLTDLVDCVCRSDEKERLLPVLHAVWGNVVPYLRAKNPRNARFFLASSQLLAAMSSYSYMRPVWRKTTLELLLDSTFFKMDMQSLRQWLVVTDHLMTHDKNSFRDLLKSISYAPNASFSSLMTSKEQEYDARAQSLKRLAFIVLGSELDQYRQQLPDIQERLAENLRACQAVPSIRAAVFLCYRVLLLRLNPPSLVSMWPAMVTELVHVLLQVEQQLSGGPDGSSDDLACAKDDHWMQLYLAACKLLETLCTLPSGYMAQFQMCHWAFVSTVSSSTTGGAEAFVPFAGRIHLLLQNKFGTMSRAELTNATASLANMKMLTGFEELRSFFYALATVHRHHPDNVSLRDAEALNGGLSHRAAIQRLEHALYVDFAEHWQL